MEGRAAETCASAAAMSAGAPAGHSLTAHRKQHVTALAALWMPPFISAPYRLMPAPAYRHCGAACVQRSKGGAVAKLAAAAPGRT